MIILYLYILLVGASNTYIVFYHMGANFRGVLIFVDFVGPIQTMKNSVKIYIDPRKYNFLVLKTANLSLFHIMHIAMLCSYIVP